MQHENLRISSKIVYNDNQIFPVFNQIGCVYIKSNFNIENAVWIFHSSYQAGTKHPPPFFLNLQTRMSSTDDLSKNFNFCSKISKFNL